MDEKQSWLSSNGVFDKDSLINDVAIQITNSKVTQVIGLADLPENAKPKHINGVISRGFVDLQVNGGGDVLLNATPDVASMKTIAKAHRQFGTTAILPTLITDEVTVLEQMVEPAIEAMGSNGIFGVHIEGPHIALTRRGTHNPKYLRPFDEGTLNSVRKLRENDVPVMLTLAPDIVEDDHITQLVDLGVVVSLGHTDATAQRTHQAVKAGASCFTHLFNAMPPMYNREPGPVGAALNSESFAGLICDGYHVGFDMMMLALRGHKTPDRVFIVSDSMPTVGGKPTFDLYGNPVNLIDGRLINYEGTFAGAHITQATGVERLVHVYDQSLEQALKMAISIPAKLMDSDHLASVENAGLNDLIVLDDAKFDGFLGNKLT